MNLNNNKINDNAKGSEKMPKVAVAGATHLEVKEEVKQVDIKLVDLKNLISLMQYADSQVRETGYVYSWEGLNKYTKKALLSTFNSVSEIQGVSATGRIAYLLSEPFLLSQIFKCTRHFEPLQFVEFIHKACEVRSAPFERKDLAKQLSRSLAKETERYGNVELQSGILDYFAIQHRHMHELSPQDRSLAEEVRDSIQSVIPDPETMDKAKAAFNFASKPIEMTQNIFGMIQNVCQGPHYELFINVMGPLTLTYVGWTARQNTSRKAVYFCLFSIIYTQIEEKYRAALITLATATVGLWTYDCVVGDNEVDLQSGEILPVAGILASFLAIYGVERKRSGEISQLFRLSKDIPNFLDTSIAFVKGLIDSASIRLYGLPFFSDQYEEFENLELQFNDLMTSSYSGQLEFSYANADKIMSLAGEYKRIAITSTSPEKKGIFSFAAKRAEVLEKVYSTFAGFLVDPHGLRQEPVSIMVVGAPGTHKTTVSEAIEREALRISLPGPAVQNLASCRANYIFTRLSYEFWDGYNALTEVVKMDDFGQVRDSIGTPNVNFEDLIRMYNTAPFPLNMSRVEEKGKIYFKAKWIVGTSNCVEGFQVASLISEAALLRRMDLLIEPIPKPEYRNKDGKLNLDHPDLQIKGVEIDVGVKNIQPDMFVYKLRSSNPMLKIDTKDHLTWNEVKRCMDRLYRMKKSLFEISMKQNQLCNNYQSVDYQSGEVSIPASRVYVFEQEKYMLIRPKNIPEISDITGHDGFMCWLAEFTACIDEVTGNLEEIPMSIASLDAQFEENLYSEDGFERTQAFLILYGALEANYSYITKDYRNLPPDIKEYAAFYLILKYTNTKTAVEWYFGGKSPEIDGGRIGYKVTRQVTHLLKEVANFMEPSNSRTFMERYVKLMAKYSITAVSLAAAIAVAVTAGKFALGYMFPDVENQGNYMSARNTNGKKNNKVRETTSGKVSLQGADTAALNLSKSILKSNGYDICLRANGSETILGTGLFLDTTHFLFPLHFFEIAEDTLLDDPEATIKIYNSAFFKVYTLEDFFSDAVRYDEGGAHCCVAKLQGMAFDKRNIIKNFITNADAATLTSVDLSVLVQLNSQQKAPFITTAKVDRINFSVLKVTKGIHYAADSAKGDCGAPIFIRDSRLQGRRIAGIHLAGTAKGHSSQNAYASLITQEMLQEMLDLFDAELQAGDESIIRDVGPSDHIHDPYSRTRIRPSPLQNTEVFPKPKKQPAKCYPHDNKDPLEIALSSYYRRELNYEEDSLELAADDLFSSLVSSENLIAEDLIPFEEALWGNDMIPNRRSIPSSTSAGYPYKYTKKSVKQDILPKREDIDIQTFNMIRDNCYSTINEANMGIRREWYYLISLKDETLPLSKILSGKARPFCGTPLELYICTKMLFGQFVEYYFTECLDKENAATLNPYLGWGTLARKLTVFDEDMLDARVDSSDYSKFDASNNKVVMNYCLEVIQRWYDQQGCSYYNKARETLFLEMTNSRHICQDRKLEWDGSLPSGSYLTLVVNCLSNGLIMRYAYYSLAREQQFITNFQSMVVFVDLGDDNIYSAHPEIRSWFNPLSISKKVEDLGFKMTSDSKGELGEWRTLREVTFLKRGFYIENNKVFCPLSLETILSTPTWSKSGPLYKKIFYDNIKFFFRELSLHPKDIWDRYSTIMREALLSIGEANIENIHMGQKWWRAEVLRNDPFTVEWM